MLHGGCRSLIFKEVLIKVTQLKIIRDIIDFSEKSDEYFTCKKHL
jgi:hypothetical protein